MTQVRITYGGYWCSPFARWQGSLAHLDSVRLAARIAGDALAERGIPLDEIDHGVLGITVPQQQSFWGVPWLMSLLGRTDVTGPTVSQACATGARGIATAAGEIAAGVAGVSLLVACDRTSNSPVVHYPNPGAAAGAPDVENWVLDNFELDLEGAGTVLRSAENVAREWQITTAEQHDVVLRRHAQYQDALAGDRAFHRRFMRLPLDVPDAKARRTVGVLEGDEGIYPTTREKLDGLEPVLRDGTVTLGGQTHPADGNAGMVLTTRERAPALSAEPGIAIRLRGVGQARVRPGLMPAAPLPAARRALEAAGLEIDHIDVVKTHNPYAVNDIVFARETGIDLDGMNNFGSSLIFGHPQGPTGLRLIIELIEELVLRGGGLGLFAGCAAGDSAMAVVVEASDEREVG